MNRKQDVGDPCRTPIHDAIMVEPRIAEVNVYIAMIAESMTVPQPNNFKT